MDYLVTAQSSDYPSSSPSRSLYEENKMKLVRELETFFGHSSNEMVDGRSFEECVAWYQAGVLRGDNVQEAYGNYVTEQVNAPYQLKEGEQDFKKLRAKVNALIGKRHSGIDAAFKNATQLHGRVKRRYCLRHLRSNVLTKTIQQNWPNAYNYMAELDEEAWTLCHDGGHQYDVMKTNLSESFNNSIKSCRMLPVTAIARITFHKLRTMFADRVLGSPSGTGHIIIPICQCPPPVTQDTFIENSGLDTQDVIIALTGEHDKGNVVGLSLHTGEPIDPQMEGIFDNYSVKYQIINSGPAIASQLLLVDEAIRAGRNMRKPT
ncbi:PREDICTED: uncharacterized protein LOC109181202 [Ipomoea nil]|uniref:uncharacterized protein LOC109181202 n=1 Tax=Ipomoea nil TaxID=35883 RepID=UPI000901CFB2|nr:PREDICTED: uncharacterized protein LOC109181202 [Ipomoea nil]